MLGYSYGTYVAYECARYLQQHCQQPVAHVVSVAGIPVEQLDSRMTDWRGYPGASPVQQLQSLLAATNGGAVPEEFSNLDFLGPALIIGTWAREMEGEREGGREGAACPHAASWCSLVMHVIPH
jgi:pimeloyl-ACP methyl ester carboxylesterase